LGSVLSMYIWKKTFHKESIFHYKGIFCEYLKQVIHTLLSVFEKFRLKLSSFQLRHMIRLTRPRFQSVQWIATLQCAWIIYCKGTQLRPDFIFPHCCRAWHRSHLLHLRFSVLKRTKQSKLWCLSWLRSLLTLLLFSACTQSPVGPKLWF